MRFSHTIVPIAALGFSVVSAAPPQWGQENHGAPQPHETWGNHYYAQASSAPVSSSPASSAAAPSAPASSASPASSTAATCPSASAAARNAWGLKNLTSLVSFGDSYTDENRLAYFIANNGSAPPVGYVGPVSTMTASGGRVWPRYVSYYTGCNIYDYAVSGAVCSNEITPRILNAIHANFPSVKEYEIPAFIADSKYVEPNGQKYMKNPADSTVYSMWIGTNDLGDKALLTDSQVPGKTIVDYTNCVFEQLDSIYANGGRYFVLQNIAPLQLSPLYGLPENGGVGPSHYWPDKPSNITEVSYRMKESAVTVNDIYKYQVPYELIVANRYPGAHFAVMDMYTLISDIYYNPSAYLNGTLPANVTGWDNHCNLAGNVCARTNSPDSFLWYDELHPSEQTDRIIAKNFVDVIKGASKYATYWSS
ncbi:hypothetical protein B0A49_12900 [Cryomyces minteri]|uniref:SGNH hydrolase-type esterase domain-containing protein n=1 Tax=Cryomyces minteri TaxID=331657 RepID=A0A4U0VWY4_9PEZI|nr:hypothetical protein B0A49_12900 [Cryomyces minteri]